LGGWNRGLYAGGENQERRGRDLKKIKFPRPSKAKARGGMTKK